MTKWKEMEDLKRHIQMARIDDNVKVLLLEIVKEMEMHGQIGH